MVRQERLELSRLAAIGLVPIVATITPQAQNLFMALPAGLEPA